MIDAISNITTAATPAIIATTFTALPRMPLLPEIVSGLLWHTEEEAAEPLQFTPPRGLKAALEVPLNINIEQVIVTNSLRKNFIIRRALARM